jgi:hypothetical protein
MTAVDTADVARIQRQQEQLAEARAEKLAELAQEYALEDTDTELADFEAHLPNMPEETREHWVERLKPAAALATRAYEDWMHDQCAANRLDMTDAEQLLLRLAHRALAVEASFTPPPAGTLTPRAARLTEVPAGGGSDA